MSYTPKPPGKAHYPKKGIDTKYGGTATENLLYLAAKKVKGFSEKKRKFVPENSVFT